jgi:hypothetical protein
MLKIEFDLKSESKLELNSTESFILEVCNSNSVREY